MRKIALGLALTVCTAPSGVYAALTIQDYDYFSTAPGFDDGNMSVYDGKAKWTGVTDSTGATPHSGTFGDGTVLDYRFVGTTRSAGVMTEHAIGAGTYIGSLSVATYGQSGGANSGLDVWTTTDPDNTGTWDTTPNSNAWGNDHVTGGTGITGTIDVSELDSAQIYFVYGSYKSAASVTLTDGDDNLLGTLSLPFDGPDNDRLVIQEVTIDNTGSTYDTIKFTYSVVNGAGAGRFSGVIIDGVVPEPASLGLLGLAAIVLTGRRRASSRPLSSDKRSMT